MDRFPVLIEHRNVRLSVYNKSLKITRPDHPIETIPFELISNLIIYGKAAVESDVWRHLNDHHVTATLLPGRGQGEPAFLGAALGNSTGLRLSQYNTYQQLELREQYAMHLVLQKHQTELRTLEALGINTQAFPQIAISAHHLPQLLGEEGQDAHRYYQRLHKAIQAIALPLQHSFFVYQGDADILDRTLNQLVQLIDESEDDLRCYPIHSLEAIWFYGQARPSHLLMGTPQLELDDSEKMSTKPTKRRKIR